MSIRVQFSPAPFCFFAFIETTIRAVNNIARYINILIVAHLGRFSIVMGILPRKLKAGLLGTLKRKLELKHDRRKCAHSFKNLRKI